MTVVALVMICIWSKYEYDYTELKNAMMNYNLLMPKACLREKKARRGYS
jgi:hypothetical protein